MLQGWIVGWAATTMISAAVQTALWESHRGIGAWANAVFQTADAVPPGAKLTLGGLLAMGLAASAIARRGDPCPLPLIAALATAVAGMLIALALPVGYYPADRSGELEWNGLHLVAAAIGGLVTWLAARACDRRRRGRQR